MKKKPDIRISVRIGEKATRKIELFSTLLPGRYKIKVDGLLSDKFETTTITEVTGKLRGWLSK